jgi:hypothetical protein
MKRLTSVLLSVVVAVVLPALVFGAPPFVEASVPDGKALIYIYAKDIPGSQFPNRGQLVFEKSGPIGILTSKSYQSHVAEPGTIYLWVVSAFTIPFKMEAVAGQIYYVKGEEVIRAAAIPIIGLKLIPNEKAKTEIAECQQLTE